MGITQGCLRIFLWMVLTTMLVGCVGNLWTGSSLIYNRHHIYKKMEDYKLSLEAENQLFVDQQFKQRDCSLELAVFNGELLVAGHLPNESLRSLAFQRLKKIVGARRLFKQIAISHSLNNGVEDMWITTKIRSQMLADSEIDPSAFKVITTDAIVYVMGDVIPEQARRVLAIARNTAGVIRVVRLFHYLNLSEHPQ
jgi:osmotically-inducible protein OsmY